LPTNDELGQLAAAFKRHGSKASDDPRRTDAAAELDAEKQRAESLLLNILTVRTAQETEGKGSGTRKYFEDVSISVHRLRRVLRFPRKARTIIW